ncbi:uncharacterized protein MONBRDRAFT_34197 [Monosiga brevicollis MX1]|uniref:Uncharacterized protein n=1 Tax=Monosiga brevicollis TaxID=81824 RepID=A9VA60_MONBE|nr:uncharacterized protein MONBRDRAFT_34197 [Monosiga brevicollis MX1]EDQ85671.1 predicted protein [Monosiga brevicollis MX1]|eukprot:XP_001749620.1 hypothetical protein [Monosiga brevicollis MX1]
MSFLPVHASNSLTLLHTCPTLTPSRLPTTNNMVTQPSSKCTKPGQHRRLSSGNVGFANALLQLPAYADCARLASRLPPSCTIRFFDELFLTFSGMQWRKTPRMTTLRPILSYPQSSMDLLLRSMMSHRLLPALHKKAGPYRNESELLSYLVNVFMGSRNRTYFHTERETGAQWCPGCLYPRCCGHNAHGSAGSPRKPLSGLDPCAFSHGDYSGINPIRVFLVLVVYGVIQKPLIHKRAAQPWHPMRADVSVLISGSPNMMERTLQIGVRASSAQSAELVFGLSAIKFQE